MGFYFGPERFIGVLFGFLWIFVWVFIVSNIIKSIKKQSDSNNPARDIVSIVRKTLDQANSGSMGGNFGNASQNGNADPDERGPQSNDQGRVYQGSSYSKKSGPSSSIFETFNQDAPKNGNLSRETRDDEKDWF